MIAYLSRSGNVLVLKIILQMYVSGDEMYGALNFNILVDISSYPLEVWFLKI